MTCKRDAAVQNTTDEATFSKLSSANLGYFTDPYIQFLVNKKDGFPRRCPLVNRGYYARVMAMRHCIESFFNCCGSTECIQVVVLGSGFDSISFNTIDIHDNIKFFEIDYPEVVGRKSQMIASNEPLLCKCVNPSFDSIEGVTQLRSENINIIGADLRDLQNLKAKLSCVGLKQDLPTLFIAECVLIYLRPKHSDAILSWIANEAVPHAFCGLVVYEQTNPLDPFGQVMIRNLRIRGCPLLGIEKYPTFESQKVRYLESLKFKTLSLDDMNTIVDICSSKEETARVSRLELFDEFEEWRLFQSHYFIAVASNCTSKETEKWRAFINMWNIDR